MDLLETDPDLRSKSSDEQNRDRRGEVNSRRIEPHARGQDPISAERLWRQRSPDESRSPDELRGAWRVGRGVGVVARVATPDAAAPPSRLLELGGLLQEAYSMQSAQWQIAPA